MHAVIIACPDLIETLCQYRVQVQNQFERMSLISANTTLFCLIDKIYFNPLISESEHYQKINIAMRIKERLWAGQYIIWNSNTEWIDLKINTSCNFTESISRVVHWSFPYNPSIKMFIFLKVHGKFIHTTYITWHNMCPRWGNQRS